MREHNTKSINCFEMKQKCFSQFPPQYNEKKHLLRANTHVSRKRNDLFHNHFWPIIYRNDLYGLVAKVY